jgi:flagellar hook-associated protein 3 FlgL
MANLFISSASMSRAASASIVASQDNIARKQAEVASGTIYDLGIEIGSKSSAVVAYKQTLAMATAQQGVNAIIGAKLEGSQTALSEMRTIAQDLVADLLATRGSANHGNEIANRAQIGLVAFGERLNTKIVSEYIFGGLAVTSPPNAGYSAGGGAARMSVLQAFEAQFAMRPGDPGAAEISPADMADFIDNRFSNEFSDAAWASNWSNATDETPDAMIGLGERQSIGVSANEAPFRQIMQAFTLVAEVASGSLSGETRSVVLDRATSLAGGAIDGLVSISSRIGHVEERVDQANQRVSLQIDTVTAQLGRMERVDAFEAITELNQLMTRLEAAYATTARIERLTILDYLA